MTLRSETQLRPGDAKPTHPTNKTTQVNGWGFFPEIAVTTGCGLLLTAAVDTAGRFGYAWAPDMFWMGLIIIFTPAFMRLLMKDVTRRERLALVILTAVALFMVKILHSPASFTLHDELLHWKTVDTIMVKHYLFTENPLLPVSPLYPGLHVTTSSIAEITGVSIYSAGVLLLGSVRIVMTVALFLLFERASQSSYVAGLATMIYMCNTNYVFFMAQFAYESLALPMGLILLVLIVSREEIRGIPRVVINLGIVSLIISVVATHHLTAYMLVVFLSLTGLIYYIWPRVEPIVRWVVDRVAGWRFYPYSLGLLIPRSDDTRTYTRVRPKLMLWGTASFVFIASLAWILYVATPTLGYLTPVFSEAFNEVLSLIRQESDSRQLFASEGGNVRPLWERLTATGAVLFTLLAFPYGMIEVWRKYRDSTLPLLFTVAAAAYFGSLGFRLTKSGWEISNRSSEFLYVGVGFMVALAIAGWQRHRLDNGFWMAVFGVFGTVLFIGGLLAGWAYWARVPGPYLIGADTRSIDEESLLAAGWTERYLPPDSRLIADRINGLLMGSYGRQYIVRSGTTDNIQSAPVLFSLTLGDWEYDILHRTETEYVVVDYRLTTALPELGVFVEIGEPGGLNHREPLSPVALDKFDTLPEVSRIFDSGNIVIYDVRAIQDAKTTPLP
jgi:hypothetical protein